MKVILDTNILVADFRLKSPSFQVLLDRCKNDLEQVYIPEIVIEETVNKFKQELVALSRKSDHNIKSINRLLDGSHKNLLTNEEIIGHVRDYSNFLHQVIKTNKVIILSYPNVPHKSIVKKALEIKKPFNSNGAGYRDCLIWENIKELITKDQDVLIIPEVIFISNNSNDFASSDNNLHPDLQQEMLDEGFNPDSLMMFFSLNEYIDLIVKLNLVQEKKIEDKLKKNAYFDFDLKTITSEYLFENLIGYELNGYEIGLPYEYETPCITSIDESFEIDEISVKKISSFKYLIDVAFDLDVWFDLFICKSDYYIMDDERQPSITSSDWNEHYMLGESSANLRISLSILVTNKLKVLSCQLNKIDNFYV